MNVKDFIVEKLNIWGIQYSQELILAEMSKIGLQDTEAYNGVNSLKVDLLLYNIIPDMIMQPNSISEGGYSISYDKNSIMRFYNLLCQRLGKPNLLDDNQDTITDISHLW